MPQSTNPLQHISKKVDKLIKVIGAKKRRDGKAAVFFDIDGTVSRNDCLELLITEIIRRDLLPQEKVLMYEKARQLWKSRETGFSDYLKVVIEIIPFLKDFSGSILNKIAQDVVDSNNYYYVFPWLLLLKLKVMGYRLIAVSGAPQFMAEIFLAKIGLIAEEINASDYHLKDNIFTGEVDLRIIKNKGKYIEDKYKNIYNLKESIALGDTLNDVPMLEKIGRSIVINPTQDLAIEAKKRRWPIVIERKDLILIFPDGQIDLD